MASVDALGSARVLHAGFSVAPKHPLQPSLLSIDQSTQRKVRALQNLIRPICVICGLLLASQLVSIRVDSWLNFWHYP